MDDKTPIMIHENKPYEQAWVLQWEDDSETARVKAWQMAQKWRKQYPDDKRTYEVNGIHY